VNLLPGVVFIALGALIIALAVAQRARRTAPIPVPVPLARCGCDMPYCAHGALPVGLGGPDLPAAELPAAAGHGVLAVVLPASAAAAAEVVGERPELAELAELSTRVTRSCVSVYRGHEPDIRLVAVWRWSVTRRRLVAYDRLDPSWSPEWTRELAERAWEAR
jgi:hypothetical protein